MIKDIQGVCAQAVDGCCLLVFGNEAWVISFLRAAYGFCFQCLRTAPPEVLIVVEYSVVGFWDELHLIRISSRTLQGSEAMRTELSAR